MVDATLAAGRGTNDQGRKVCAMTTIRLTAAQAMVRFLSAQRVEIDGRKQRLFEGVFAIFGHGNVAGLGEALYAARDVAADLPRPQRAGDGACRDRLRQGLAAQAHDGLHHLDRPRRDQHGHRRRGRACQPPAGAADPRRRVRQPQARSGAAAGRGLRRRNGQRQRLLPPGVALFRPHHAARADRAGAEPGDRGADRSGRVRAGDARLLPGRADRGLRLSGELLRRARASPAPRCARPARGRGGRRAPASGQEAAGRLRRRRALFRRRARADRLLREARHSGRRDAGRQVGDARRSSAGHGRDRRHRHRRGQRARRGGRCDRRRRHALRRFHHRLVGAVQESRPAVHRPQRAAVRRRKHRALPLVGDARDGAGRARRARSARGRRRARGATAPPRPRRNGRRRPRATPRRPTRRCRPTPR